MSKCFEKKENNVASSGFEPYVTGIANLEVDTTYTKLAWWKDDEKFVLHTCYYCDMMQKKSIIAKLYDGVNNKSKCEVGAVQIIMKHLATNDSVGETEKVDQMSRLIYHLPLT